MQEFTPTATSKKCSCQLPKKSMTTLQKAGKMFSSYLHCDFSSVDMVMCSVYVDFTEPFINTL